MQVACHDYGDFGKGAFGSSYHAFTKSKDYDSSEMHGIGELKPRTSTENEYCRLLEEINSDEERSPLLDYLSTFKLEESLFYLSKYMRDIRLPFRLVHILHKKCWGTCQVLVLNSEILKELF